MGCGGDDPARHDSLAGKGVYPPRWAFMLLFPLRKLIFSPATLIRRLELLDGMKVLEVGPGPGYFSVPLAKAMPAGHLVLADIQPEMLAKAESRIKQARKRMLAKDMARVDCHVCDGLSFPFEDDEFDRIVLVAVLGEVAERERYLLEFRRMLKPSGLVSVTELAGDPDRLSAEDINDLASRAGLIEARRFPGRLNCTVNLRPSGHRGYG